MVDLNTDDILKVLDARLEYCNNTIKINELISDNVMVESQHDIELVNKWYYKGLKDGYKQSKILIKAYEVNDGSK